MCTSKSASRPPVADRAPRSAGSAPTRRLTRSVATLLAIGLATPGCLGPLVDDEVIAAYDLVYPKGTSVAEVPEAEDDPLLESQILAHQGFEGASIRMISAFADGVGVRYWDFGPAPGVAIPIYLIVSDIAEDGSFETIDHPTIIDAVPGDPGYSPFWQVFIIPTTDAFDGEVVTSFAAVQEARDSGLLGEPVKLDAYVNCPVVHRDVKLELESGWAKPVQFFYRGLRASYFAFGLHGLAAGSNAVHVGDVYHLRREGGEPLDETVRGVDMTGDGDTDDSNQIFDATFGDDDFSPLVMATEIVIAADTPSIDTSGDELVSDVDAEADLFDEDGDPISPPVIAIYPSDDMRNLVHAGVWPEADEDY